MKLNEANCLIQTRIIEKRIDEASRTVTAGILEGDSASKNRRFYPMSVVESVRNLVGKKSLIGHDSDSPEDVVAQITSSTIEGKRLIGAFKFGTDEKSQMIFTKIKEGLIDSVSIRASGETKPGRINNEDMDIVQSLDIWSVDWVCEGGVESAKVMQVFESAPKIEYKQKEKSMNEQEIKDLQEKLKVAEEARLKLEADNAKLEEEKKKAELDSYKTAKLSTIEDKDIRSHVAENLSGDTKEAIDASFGKLKKLAEGVAKKSGHDLKLEPVKETNDDPSCLNDVLESKNVDRSEKVAILSSMLG